MFRRLWKVVTKLLIAFIVISFAWVLLYRWVPVKWIPLRSRLPRTASHSAEGPGGEKLWSKERTMEVYLNVAETGKGLFGVDAASRKYFERSASKLNTHQAVSIACVLPNPYVRNPKTVSQKNQTKYNTTYKCTEITPYPFE